MEFVKRFKKEDEVHGTYEFFSEVFASRMGKELGLPVLDIRVTEEGLKMKRLSRSVRDVNDVKNSSQVKKTLPFEEWILNIDLKEDHVMVDEEGYAFVIDHGHSLLAWKPLYYVYEIIGKSVTRFKLWSDKAHYREGVEIVRSVDKQSWKTILKESVNEVLSYKPLSQPLVDDFLHVSLTILDYREKILCSFG